MREKLNENPVAQIALIAVLALLGGYLVLTHMGGSGSSKAAPEATAESGVAATATPVSATSSISPPVDQPLPGVINRAYNDGDTIALLIYRPGGIDDRRVTEAVQVLEEMPDVALFTTPADKIARYSQITGPLGVSGTPALIVVRPRRLNGDGAAPATVTYGFQTAADIRQAVVDANYHGPQLTYAPQ
jgi:hypothetical protein